MPPNKKPAKAAKGAKAAPAAGKRARLKTNVRHNGKLYRAGSEYSLDDLKDRDDGLEIGEMLCHAEQAGALAPHDPAQENDHAQD